jgi:hypothetical protein
VTSVCFGLFIMFCSPTQASPITDSYCKVSKVITWSRKDTVETLRQIKRHNKTHASICKGT